MVRYSVVLVVRCVVLYVRMLQVTMEVQDGWKCEDSRGKCMRVCITSPVSYSASYKGGSLGLAQ